MNLVSFALSPPHLSAAPRSKRPHIFDGFLRLRYARLGGGVDYVTHRIRHGQPATADPTRGTPLGPGGQKRLGYVSTCVENCTKPIGPLPICRDLYRYRLYTAVRGRVGCCSFGAYCTSLFLVQETVDFRW